MPPPSNVPVLRFQEQILAHEERIQRLETGFNEVSKQLAAQNVQLDYISTAIHDSMIVINQKLDILAPVSVSVEYLDQAQEDHAARLVNLEEQEKRRLSKREERHTNYGKLVWGLLIALGGAMGKEVGVFVWHFLNR